MLVLTQQAELENVENSKWEDVDVPHDVTTVQEWKDRLVRQGICGRFRAVFVPDSGSAQIHEFRIEERKHVEAVDL